MTTKSTTPSSASMPDMLDDEKFAVNRIQTAQLEANSATIVFEVEVHHHRIGQKIFCGLLDRELKAGVGLSIDTKSGEVVDLINDQGIIGFLNEAPLPESEPLLLRLSMDKFGSTHICNVEISGEHILYPAVLLDEVNEIGAVLGSTLSEQHGITFENARIEVDPGVTAAA